MRLLLVAALTCTSALAALHAPPDPPPLLPPLPPLPGADAAPLATQLTLTPDQAAALATTASTYKNATVAAVATAKGAVNASLAAAATKLNATLAAKERLFSDAVLLPGGGIRAGGVRGGVLPFKKANASDGGFLSSELALADGVKSAFASSAAQAQQAVADAKTKVATAWASRKTGAK